MGKRTPQAPAPPDPRLVGAAQTSQNIQTGIANSIMGNANESSPYGTVSYNQIGSHTITGPNGESYNVPQFHRNVTLSPEQQGLYDQQTTLGRGMNNLAIDQVGRLGSVLGSPMSMNGLPTRTDAVRAPGSVTAPGLWQNVGGNLYTSMQRMSPDARPELRTSFADSGPIATSFTDVGGPRRTLGPSDFSEDRRRVEDAIYSRLEPQIARDRDALETRLVNQGFARGSAGFNEEMDAINRQSNDARMQAVLAGGGEQSRLFGLDLARGGFENAAQEQAYQQALGRGQFQNQGQQQQFGQDMARAGFGNTALQQMADNAYRSTAFDNTALQADLDNRARAFSFDNATAQQDYENRVGASQRDFDNSFRSAEFGNTSRERALQEQLTMRNQPINEISALMSGGQVTAPQFAQYQGGNIAPTPIGDYTYNTAALNNQQYQQQMQQQNAMMGGLFGLGSSALLGGMRFGFNPSTWGVRA